MNIEPQPSANEIVKLSGPIRDLRKTRAEANFVFTQEHKGDASL